MLTLLLLAFHADPALTDLWEAGKGGYALYRIPALAVTAKGTLLAACEARKHARSDWGHIDLLLRRSADGGRTFSGPVKIAILDGKFDRNPAAARQKLGIPGEVTINNPVLIARRDGTVHFLYCVEYARVFHRVSVDDGLTWSKAVEITAALEPMRKAYPWLVVGTGPGHALEHSSGRLIVPVWLSTGTGGHAHRPSVVTTLVSEDGGKTWKAGDIVAHEKEPLLNPSETTAAELPDGRIMLNIRSESKQRRRAYSTSKDGLTGWTAPAFDDDLLEPVCMGSLLNVGKVLYFSNPYTKAGRSNLTVARSGDGGKTWTRRTVYKGPSAYSDLAAGPDGTLWCLFERGEGKSPYRWLTLAKLPRD